MAYIIIPVLFIFFFIIGIIALIAKVSSHSECIDNNTREINNLKKYIKELEDKISELYYIISKSDKSAKTEKTSPSPDVETPVSAAPVVSAAPSAPPVAAAKEQPVEIKTADADVQSEITETKAAKEEIYPASTLKSKNPVSLWSQLTAFAKGGNLWVAGGVVLLFIAFVFLLTYMASRGFFTIEMRIAASGLSGIAMFIFGWRFRLKKPAYSLILQGGGIGILYISFFAASKFTTLLSPFAALVLISFLIPPTIILALLQHSQPLAVFGLLGGFAAPILLSDGSGSHIALFSYYIVLNIGVVAIGRYRLWRALNFIAFICTLGFVLIWTIFKYNSDMIFSVEPFVAGFIVLFTFLGIQTVHNDKIAEKKYIDIPLIIGTPLVGAIIQWQIFSKIEHGLSVISIVFSALYLLLTFAVWKYSGINMRQLAETYLGLSVFLGNLAIPLELSPEVTSAVWAAEGALVFYYGKRFLNNRIKTAGLILHAASAFWFIIKESHVTPASLSFRNPAFIGGVIISLSAFIIALFADRINKNKKAVSAGEDIKEKSEMDISVFRILVFWGFIWWFSVWGIEINRVFPVKSFQVFFIFASVSSLLFFCIAKYLRAPLLLVSNLIALSCGIFFVLGTLLNQTISMLPDSPLDILNFNFFYELYLWGWIAFFVIQAILLYFTFKNISYKVHSLWLFSVLLIFVITLTCTGREYTIILGLSKSWRSFAGIIPSMACIVLLSLSVKHFIDLPEFYKKIIFVLLPAILSISTSIWFLGCLFSAGNPDPLPLYIPFLNPLDLQQAFCIAIIVFWQLSLHRVEIKSRLSKSKLFYVSDIMAFLWLTAIVARCSYYFLGIPYYRVFDSGKFHLMLLIFWGLYGIGHILAGYKMKKRKIWFAGAVLTVVDIVKLLIIDLAHTGTITRIVSFFIAGLLLLFIGWVAPLPPILGNASASALGSDSNSGSKQKE